MRRQVSVLRAVIATTNTTQFILCTHAILSVRRIRNKRGGEGIPEKTRRADRRHLGSGHVSIWEKLPVESSAAQPVKRLRCRAYDQRLHKGK